MANTNGGTIYIGAPPDPTLPVIGVKNISANIELLRDEIEHKLTPPLGVEVEYPGNPGQAGDPHPGPARR